MHRNIDEEIYMLPLEGYHKAIPGQVSKLQRSLYGLKQALRQWNLELTKFLQGKGFKLFKSDYSLFAREQNGLFTFVLVDVDDSLTIYNNALRIDQLKQDLHATLTIKV